MDISAAFTLCLLGCAARGDTPRQPLEEIDWQRVYRLCREQQCLSLAFPPAARLVSGGYGGVPEDLLGGWKGYTVRNVFLHTLKQTAVLRVLKKMEDEGIEHIVLKGDTLAWRYAEPQYRTSLDTDLIIPPRLEKKTLALMSDLGAEVTARVKKYHHSRCVFPDAGLIEVHISLVDEIYSDICFSDYNKKKFEELQTRRALGPDGMSAAGLDGKDEFIFVFIHFAKHFISSGCSIRNVLDVLVLMNAGLYSIDWAEIKEYFTGLGMGTLLAAVAKAGVTRFGFAPEALPDLGQCPQELSDGVLESIFNMGLTKGETGHENVFAFYRKRFAQKKRGSYAVYMLRWRLPRVLEHFFPGAEKLRLEYPFARKNALLLPVAFVRNILRGVREFSAQRKVGSLFDIGDKNAIDEASDGRMKLFKDLDMF